MGVVLINIMMSKLAKNGILFLLVTQIWSLFHVEEEIVGVLVMVSVRAGAEIHPMVRRFMRRPGLRNRGSLGRAHALLACVRRRGVTYLVVAVVRAFEGPLTHLGSQRVLASS